MNNPSKILEQTALLFCALFFLFESRESLGRDRWRAHITFGLMTALLTAYASIPALIYFFVTGEVLSVNIAYTLLLFTFSVLIACKVIYLQTAVHNQKTHPYIKALTEFSDAREYAVAAEEEARAAREQPDDEADASEKEPAQDEKSAETTGNAEVDAPDCADAEIAESEAHS